MAPGKFVSASSILPSKSGLRKATCPDTGIQRRVTPKNKINIRPSQKLGMDCPSMAPSIKSAIGHGAAARRRKHANGKCHDRRQEKAGDG